MTIRQLFYVSTAKTDALEAELYRHRRLRRTEFTGGIGIAGTKVEAKVPGRSGEVLQRVGRLTERMERKGAMTPLPESGDLAMSSYYRDDAEWSHGLFAFEGDFSLQENARVVTYVLWRRWADALILLAGSPENVLGEKVVREGVWAYGTSGTWATILHFAEQALRTDEPNLVGVTESGARVGELPWAPIDSRFTGGPEQVTPAELWSSNRGIALCALCLGHLSRLPPARIDTAFRVSQRLDLGLRGSVPDWAADMVRQHGGGRNDIEYLRHCRTVYVGSPLFTALL